MIESTFVRGARYLCRKLSRYYVQPVHTEIKAKVKIDHTPVTDLDHYALESFRRLIEKHFPDQYTIGEEDLLSPDELRRLMFMMNEPQWSIDGLDGTWHFQAGTNSYGAAIARRLGSWVEEAIIFRPIDWALHRSGFFWAARGKGAWEWCSCTKCGGTYNRLRTAKHNHRRLVVMLEGSSREFWNNAALANIGKTLTTRPSLSSCIAATTVARGNAEARAVVTARQNPWDGWPIALFIDEAGGVVTDHAGKPYSAHDCSNLVAAANREDHAAILRIMEGGAA